LATQIAAGAIGLRVIGIDSGNKREIVMESGAEHFIDFTASKDIAKEVMDLTGGLGAHAVVNLTASNSAYAM
jgi:propanol-preferring alcohol dehydrogenase